MSETPRIYVLKKDELDPRDFLFKSSQFTVSTADLPKFYDLRTTNFLPPVLNQANIGSCAANQLSNSLRFCLKKNNFSDFQPSRLFIYFFTRLYEGSPLNEDTGVTIRGALNAIKKYGVCSELNWVYDTSKFAQQPTRAAILAARTHMPGFKYTSVPQNLVNIKQAIYGGYPIVFGIQIYESFESKIVAKTGIVPLPNKTTERLLGGHCILLVAFCDSTQTFTCANSWGDWGMKGYFTLPYKYVLDNSLASDFWIVNYFK